MLCLAVGGLGLLLIKERKVSEGVGLILLAAVYGWASTPL